MQVAILRVRITVVKCPSLSVLWQHAGLRPSFEQIEMFSKELPDATLDEILVSMSP